MNDELLKAQINALIRDEIQGVSMIMLMTKKNLLRKLV